MARSFINVSLPQTERSSRWDVGVDDDGTITSVRTHSLSSVTSSQDPNHNGAILAPSLCHPHVHIDKAYLLAHPRYADLQVQKGDFAEAMSLTGQAKAQFTHEDVLERGQRLVDESVAAGVTHMRAFVEIDAGVETKCLDAGLELRRRAMGRCQIQLCAFAQLPLWTATSDDEDGQIIRGLMETAAQTEAVQVLGSTPYVEDDRSRMEQNVKHMIDLCITHKKHLDLHLDYNLDRKTKPLIWYVLDMLCERGWTQHNPGRTVVLGHCTRLALFTSDEWKSLAEKISSSRLPVSFVGLPTSDLYMMRTGDVPEVRGTLNVLRLIKEYQLNACLGMNNIGNAFTPHGSCDPLSLACQGVGYYQAGTIRDAELLYECVSTRARAAIGLGDDRGLSVNEGQRAGVVVYATDAGHPETWHARRTVSELVYLYDGGRERRVYAGGRLLV